MVNILDWFYYNINLLCFVMKLAGMICKLDMFLEICRLCHAICKLAGQSTNWQIGRNISTLNESCTMIQKCWQINLARQGPFVIGPFYAPEGNCNNYKHSLQLARQILLQSLVYLLSSFPSTAPWKGSNSELRRI